MNQLNILNYQSEEPEKNETAAQQSNQAPLEVEVVKSEDIPRSSAGTDLIVVDQIKDLTVFSKDKGLDPFIDEIKKIVESEIFDVTTAKGRERIGSVARQIGSAKMRVVEQANALTEDWKNKTKIVNAERDRMIKRMDALRDEVLKPRDEYEAREKKRVSDREDRINEIKALGVFVGAVEDQKLDDLRDRLTRVGALSEFDWMEFEDRAKEAIRISTEDLTGAIERKTKYDEDQAELARLRQAEEERKKREEADRIAREAREGTLKTLLKVITNSETVPEGFTPEQLMVVVENVKSTYQETLWQEYQMQADEAYNRILPLLQQKHDQMVQKRNDEIEAERKRVEEERIAGIRRKIKEISLSFAEQEGLDKMGPVSLETHLKIRQHQFETTDWQELKAEAEKAFNDTATLLNEKLAVAKKREEEAEQKRQEKLNEEAQERAAQKLKDDEAQKQKEEEARKADLEHRRKINREVLEDIEKAFVNVDSMTGDLKCIVEAIAKGEVRHVSIKY